MALEMLHFALVLFGGRARSERAQVPAPAGLRIGLARIRVVLAGLLGEAQAAPLRLQSSGYRFAISDAGRLQRTSG
jgi:hypothetical protein